MPLFLILVCIVTISLIAIAGYVVGYAMAEHDIEDKILKKFGKGFYEEVW